MLDKYYLFRPNSGIRSGTNSMPEQITGQIYPLPTSGLIW